MRRDKKISQKLAIELAETIFKDAKEDKNKLIKYFFKYFIKLWVFVGRESARAVSQYKPEFIIKRIDKVAKEHAGRISEQQQEFISLIAEIFAS